MASSSRQAVGQKHGALAQLGERLICIQEVRSSILLGSTNLRYARIGVAYDWFAPILK